MSKPTLDMYGFVQTAFDHFNQVLFAGELPQPLLTFQREKNVFGYFSFQRWQGADGGHTHEIALNPMYFLTHNPLELMQTIVHEMCHLWQYEFGEPSRSGYHNAQWAEKMESIGLMPSDNGQPGGKKTGQRMSDYPIPGGRFYQACVALSAEGYKLPFVDTHHPGPHFTSAQIRQISEALMDALNDAFNSHAAQTTSTAVDKPFFDDDKLDSAVASLSRPFSDQFELSNNETMLDKPVKPMYEKSKVCYQCPGCGIKLWGKPDLSVICGECEVPLESR